MFQHNFPEWYLNSSFQNIQDTKFFYRIVEPISHLMLITQMSWSQGRDHITPSSQEWPLGKIQGSCMLVLVSWEASCNHKDMFRLVCRANITSLIFPRMPKLTKSCNVHFVKRCTKPVHGVTTKRLSCT